MRNSETQTQDGNGHNRVPPLHTRQLQPPSRTLDVSLVLFLTSTPVRLPPMSAAIFGLQSHRVFAPFSLGAYYGWAALRWWGS